MLILPRTNFSKSLINLFYFFLKQKAIHVTIEIGHKAWNLRERIYDYTHKWNIFVRSGEDNQHFDKLVQKVVFNLHETFDNPTRVLTTPPFCVKENGYGEFELPIDIYFHGSSEKYSLNYFLKLPPLNTTQPLAKLRREIITFLNPCADFRRKLIEGGASVQALTSSEAGAYGSSKSVKGPIVSTPSSLISNHQLVLNASLDANNHETNSLVKNPSKKKHSLNNSVNNVSTSLSTAVKQPQKLNNSNGIVKSSGANTVSSSKSIKNSQISSDSTTNSNHNVNSNINNSTGKVSNGINTNNDPAIKKGLTNKKVRVFHFNKSRK